MADWGWIMAKKQLKESDCLNREQRIAKKRTAVSEEEEQRILAFLFEGRAPYAIGQIVGRDRGVVVRIARRHARELSEVVQRRLKFGDEVVQDGLTAYTRYVKSENRQAMLSQSLDKIERMLQRDNLPAKDVRDLLVSVGIIIDKFAVESGRTDNNSKAALIAMFQKMEQNMVVNEGGVTSTSGKASAVHISETEANEHSMGELEEQQVGCSGSEVDKGCTDTS